MVCATVISGLVLCSGFARCPLRRMWYVCKNVTVFLWMRSPFGSRVQVFFVLCPRVLIIRVVALCYLGRLSLLFVHGLMTMAGFSSANSLTVARFFVSLVCMRQIATRSARSFMMMFVCGLTLPSPRCCAGILMLCLIV